MKEINKFWMSMIPLIIFGGIIEFGFNLSLKLTWTIIGLLFSGMMFGWYGKSTQIEEEGK